MGVAQSFDFAVLGDTQPEGILVAAALARKGYAVVVVPSQSLGELGSDESWPLVLPERVFHRRLNDLLFRAGFFRLEDSGLVPWSHQSQIVLSKNRFHFDGTHKRWSMEIERELPFVSVLLNKILDGVRKDPTRGLRKASVELQDLMKRNAALADFLRIDIEQQLKVTFPSGESSRDLEIIRSWLRMTQRESVKVYRVDPKLKQPYTQYLLDHARRWGVQCLAAGELRDLTQNWGGFGLTETASAKNLLLNSVGASRALAKSLYQNEFQDRFMHWLYWDSFQCKLEDLPEPLDEFCTIDYGDATMNLPSQRLLWVQKSATRETAQVSLGSWLPFDDHRLWAAQIEKGRTSFQRFLPFLPISVLRPIPASLELTEMRGEVLRRGAFDRLMLSREKPEGIKRFFAGVSRWASSDARQKVVRLKRRIYPLIPHYLAYRNRVNSLAASLTLLDHFDPKKKKSVSLAEAPGI